jgi:hypothetical protein
MDWNKLQHTLFALDPSDPAEDLRKLKESAGATGDVAPTKDYVVESVEVAQGSMPVEGNYSIADFAALAGVTLTEAQKKGSAGQLKGKDAIKKQPAGTTKNPTRDKLVGEADDKMSWRDAAKRGWNKSNNLGAIGLGKDDIANKLGFGAGGPKEKSVTTKQSPTKKTFVATAGDWKGFLKQHTAQLQQIAADPNKKKKFDKFMAEIAESVEEAAKPKPVKARDPSAQYMNDLRKSGAMGAHKDKKRDAKMGKEKHKGKEYTTESIKAMLYRKLNESK